MTLLKFFFKVYFAAHVNIAALQFHETLQSKC